MRKRFVHSDLTTAVALCTPAVRMYVVYVFQIEGGEICSKVMPVLAIKSEVVTHFFREARYELDVYEHLPSADAYIDAGWNCEGHAIEEHLVIHDDQEYGLINHDDSLMNDCAEVRTVVSCPWPQDEARDQEVISKAIAGLTPAAKEAYEYKVKRDAKIAADHKAKTQPPTS